MSKFIYVFQEEAKDALEKREFKLLKFDKRNKVWIFENKKINSFEFELEFPFVLSNTLSF